MSDGHCKMISMLRKVSKDRLYMQGRTHRLPKPCFHAKLMNDFNINEHINHPQTKKVK